jgi:hypothetical protein
MIMAKHDNDSQVMLILNHLKSGAEINPLEAFSKYGCYRLGAVIYILKREGYSIATRLEYYIKPSGRRGHYAVYRLEESKV